MKVIEIIGNVKLLFKNSIIDKNIELGKLYDPKIATGKDCLALSYLMGRHFMKTFKGGEKFSEADTIIKECKAYLSKKLKQTDVWLHQKLNKNLQLGSGDEYTKNYKRTNAKYSFPRLLHVSSTLRFYVPDMGNLCAFVTTPEKDTELISKVLKGSKYSWVGNQRTKEKSELYGLSYKMKKIPTYPEVKPNKLCQPIENLDLIRGLKLILACRDNFLNNQAKNKVINYHKLKFKVLIIGYGNHAIVYSSFNNWYICFDPNRGFGASQDDKDLLLLLLWQGIMTNNYKEINFTLFKTYGVGALQGRTLVYKLTGYLNCDIWFACHDNQE